MFRSYSMELAGRTLTAEIGRVAEQANGACLMRYGDTTVLVTATASDKPREGIDFFPLSIDYEERLYSRRLYQKRGQTLRKGGSDSKM